ncbi:MAG: hypothetical protein ACLQPH_17505 [Acidimicrobiales bacterium]
MTIFLACVSGAALIVSVVALVQGQRSVGHADRSATASEQSAGAAERSALAAESANRLAREPDLTITLVAPTPSPSDKAIYSIRNEGPQDLTSVVVYRPKPPDRITYPLAVTGGTGWQDDEISLGPVALGEEVRFTLCCGAADQLPEFRVRIECEAGNDWWPQSRPLPPPRPQRPPAGARGIT